MLDVKKIRADFPILSRKVNGQDLVYFDNAATSQTPQKVIDVIVDYYSRLNANIHRGVHKLSQEATDAYEEARIKIQKHFNAAQPYEIILTSGTTESINLIASGYSTILQAGDQLIISALEHHSNIVPWQMLCEKTGAELKVIPMTLDLRHAGLRRPVESKNQTGLCQPCFQCFGDGKPHREDYYQSPCLRRQGSNRRGTSLSSYQT